MKKHILTLLFVMVLLALTAGVAIAVWEDTKETQVTATILPLPGGTFRFIYPHCTEAVVGFGAYCGVDVLNESPTPMVVDTITITTSHPGITISEIRWGPHGPVDPGWTIIIMWDYLVDPSNEPGEVIFDVEVTCSGE